MISGKLIHLIESHGDQIIHRVTEQIRRDPDMTHIRVAIGAELPQWRQDFFENLSHWLAAGNEETLAHRYEGVGRKRFEENVPLDECVRGLCILREKMLDYVEEHILNKDSLELYAEEELDRRIGRFFDLVTIHLVRGYEQALRRAVAA